MSMLLASPKDVWRDVASYLDAPDLFHFLSAHEQVHVALGKSRSFWISMLVGGEDDGVALDGGAGGDDDDDAYDDARREYVIRAYERRLPAVRWHKLISSPRSGGLISPREGHLACTFSGGGDGEERAVITGGFSDDPGVYVLRSSRGASSQWTRLQPPGPRDFVYGASLTVLDSTRAGRFGGFRSGGYSDECNDLMLLTLEEGDLGNLACRWERVGARNSHLAAPRAYHTATLINGRYLVVLGGMTESGSILALSVLDTHDWMWLDIKYHDFVSIISLGAPSGRHGHSVVLDERRDRLVLFGGGSGTDLLRSGEDNSEVWEYKMGYGWRVNLEGSFPWKWRKVHRDIEDEVDDLADDASGGSERNVAASKLTPSEALCLGRCHCGLKISPDTALLLLGSGSPSTNGVVAFDLSTDTFFRPHALGSLPQPRFTSACTTLGRGYILVHGGFSSQDSRMLGDSYVLDLAPFVKDREFTILLIDARAGPHRAVADEDARNGRARAGGRRSAQEILDRMADGIRVQAGNAREYLLMGLLANGNVPVAAQFLGDSDSVFDEGSDDEDNDSEEGIDEAIEGR
jgi:hypothetical protein